MRPAYNNEKLFFEQNKIISEIFATFEAKIVLQNLKKLVFQKNPGVPKFYGKINGEFHFWAFY